MKGLAASFVAMLFVDTIGGGVKPFGGDAGVASYLPSPRRYLATFLLWGLLGLVAGANARFASRVGWVTLLAATFIGPAGGRLVGFLNTSSDFFQTINDEQGATG